MTAPTRLTGYVDDVGWMGNILADVTETIPDLEWPTSVGTYGQMRREPQLAAVLKALTLPTRRATWQVDPMGAKGRAVKLVADGFGLPVAGKPVKPSGARVRGVRWGEVNRLGLLDLVFGHFGLEERYDIVDGQARLAVLSERMPQTITTINVHEDGRLKSIEQMGVPSERPPIPAEHLLWYAHEREGSAWQGTSVLRPAYAPWLLKREMLRAQAIGHRRFNHGIPVGRWQPGADPTPAQQTELGRFVQAMRAGDQGGGSPPPGSYVEIVGITGGIPDTLAFTRYLDQQMSRMALAGMLDLGETPNGSRALGAEFVDLFLLSLQAHADFHAEETASQTAARLVAYNWGDAEPVPAVVVADVGSKREVTVEALQLLLASGAVTADPALERWVRSEWRLPLVEEVPPMPESPAEPEPEPPAG